MIATLPTSPAQQASHYCPVCLRRVRAARRAHRETCRSGDIDVSLLLCPTCGLTLAADIGTWTAAESAASLSALG